MKGTQKEVELVEDIQGKALYDFFIKKARSRLKLHNQYGSAEEMPLQHFFRNYNQLPDLERFAMALCTGRVLDIGAGAGAHSLILQDQGLEVEAIEISEKSIEVMQTRGVRKVVNSNILDFDKGSYDTLLLMMNGIGIAGTISQLPGFLNHFKQLLCPGGQILMDSSDIGYLYQEVPKPEDRYYGEISYRYEYDGRIGNWFNWLYIDQDTLKPICESCGYDFQVIYQDASGHYLCRLRLAEEN